MSAKRKTKSKADKVREYLDKNLYANDETVGSLGVQEIKVIVGVADTDELVEVLDLLDRGVPVQTVRDRLGLPEVVDDSASG